MDITQSDRDSLRASQHKLHPQTIGNLIEHKTQDPKKYKQVSRLKQDEDKEDHKMPKIKYRSKYLHTDFKSKQLSSIEENQEPELPIDPKEVHANFWLNMDQVEFDKLEWMNTKAVKKHLEKMEGKTKFDSEGRAIPNTEEDNTTTNDGHDIESLVNLLDSAYQPQVTYALNVITKIASLATMGYYDGAFDENILDVLIKNSLLRVRHQVDSPNETICQSALKCLRSLICNTQVDEVIMDRIHPIFSENPDSIFWLNSDCDAYEFTIEMKDIECIEIDTILALVRRTNILNRFMHLLQLKTGAFNFIYQDCILDIIIRFARHSPQVCRLLFAKNFILLITNLFLPVNITVESKKARSLALKALKLIRILAQSIVRVDATNRQNMSYNQQMGDLQITGRIPQEVLPIIEAYFFIDCYSLQPNQADHLFKLHIETLRILKVMCYLDEYREKVVSLMTMGREKLYLSFKAMASLKSTKPMDAKISFDWQYAAHLIDLTGTYLKYERSFTRDVAGPNSIWSTYVKPILLQWLTDIVRSKCIPFIDISVTVATAVRHFKITDDDPGSKYLVDLLIDSFIRQDKETKGHNYDFFKVLARSACNKSQLPRFLEENGKLRDPKGLPSYGFLCFNTDVKYEFKISPLVDNESPYILLNMFILQLQQDKLKTKANLNHFIDNLDLIRYIRSVTNYQSLDGSYELLVQQSLVAQYEVQMISSSLLLLALYYLERSENENDDNKEIETAELRQTRVECYSNLCYHTISVIGILNLISEDVCKMKDKLFEKILLNSTFQRRVTRYIPAKMIGSSSHEVFGGAMYDSGSRDILLTDDRLNVLIPIYLSCDQTDRFWVYQPILEYYFGQIRDLENAKKQDRWFQNNLVWRTHTGELASCSDNEIISIILIFNSTLMFYSPSYSQLMVSPNIEDYLCLTGCLFLDDDIFLDEKVLQPLTHNLQMMIYECIGKSAGKYNVPFQDASKIIKPLELPLADFFNKLVDQFESVSYGNSVFANYLLLFITPGSDKLFRRKLFQEKAETCLRQIRIDRSNLWAPAEMFFETQEKDPEIRALIGRSRDHIIKGTFLDEYRQFHTSK